MKVDFYLASSSPRRLELLGHFIKPLQSLSPSVDETPKKGESPSRFVARISRSKALAVLHRLKSHRPVIILAADTTVTFSKGKIILNKPRSSAEAMAMLKQISGKKHWVLTSFTVLSAKNGKVKKISTHTVRSTVEMIPLSQRDIRNYIKVGESMDKAGAYAAQGVGGCLIKSINGSVTNVIGLPMAQVLECLKTEFKFKLL
jgi:septum formation protein